MKPRLALISILIITCFAGCQHPRIARNSTRNTALLNQKPNEEKLSHPDTPESIASAILLTHGFPPPVFVDDDGSARLAISPRPKSEAEFVLALLKISPDGGVAV